MESKGYRIEPAQVAHLPTLQAIERAAAELFPAWVIPQALRESVLPMKMLAAAQREGRLWVALAPDRAPVGFVIAREWGDVAFLSELDVHPDHQCRGLGRALVKRAAEWAAARGFPALTLTTFANLPWNAPFYERLGFQRLTRSELSVDLARLLREEARRGLRERVAMRLTLTAD
ncbi:GNAT family N-acetyltransferase [Litchfieldella rifensis]|uniref:GNAT family N-acetyltransferase n=1 Tax=Litchfieldella rifensis TaxID=762643 RepID=A0ABV7LQE7_9GAMM